MFLYVGMYRDWGYTRFLGVFSHQWRSKWNKQEFRFRASGKTTWGGLKLGVAFGQPREISEITRRLLGLVFG